MIERMYSGARGIEKNFLNILRPHIKDTMPQFMPIA
jgi:hypothetical protein